VLLTVLFGLSVLGMSLPLFGENGTRRPTQVTNSERVNFAPGGIIRLETPLGNLSVDAWDQPEVEILTVRSSWNAIRCEGSVRVVTERRSPAELAVSVVRPSVSWSQRLSNRCGITIDEQVHVPRDSRLVIHHGAGYVSVSRVSGDIEVTSRSGDIVLMLPDLGPYSIDAKSKVGGVSSDFEGTTHRTRLVGEEFTGGVAPSSRRIYLRMGLGDIVIKDVPPTPVAAVTAGVSN
jgi:hypothetical protein